MERAGLIAYSHGEYFTLGEAIGRFGWSVRRKKAAKADAPAGRTERRAGPKDSAEQPHASARLRAETGAGRPEPRRTRTGRTKRPR